MSCTETRGTPQASATKKTRLRDDPEPGSGKIRRRPTLPHGDRAVPSALEGLTAVFGMGTGVSPPLSPPETESGSNNRSSGQVVVREQASGSSAQAESVVKPHGHLVPVSSTPYGASTPGLSTSSSSRGLQGPCGPGMPYLEVGFPLICFQRLSRPHIATRRCGWRHNRITSGASIPVLSY